MPESEFEEELGVYYSGSKWHLNKTGNFLESMGELGEGKIILK
jgi:hypothetical protein